MKKKKKIPRLFEENKKNPFFFLSAAVHTLSHSTDSTLPDTF